MFQYINTFSSCATWPTDKWTKYLSDQKNLHKRTDLYFKISLENHNFPKTYPYEQTVRRTDIKIFHHRIALILVSWMAKFKNRLIPRRMEYSILLGHSLGLAHSPVQDSIMYPFYKVIQYFVISLKHISWPLINQPLVLNF